MQQTQLNLKPVPLRLYPTMESLADAIEYAKSTIPEEHWNNMATAMMIYHNTLLSEIKKEQANG